MQIVIDIEEERYNQIKCCADNFLMNGLERAIKHGTPLPKGHGDLIDRSKLKTHYVGTDIGTDLEVYLVPTIDEAPTIIEADRSGEE